MLSVLLAVFFATDPSTWYDHYVTGVRLVEQGQAAAAQPHLEAALAAHKKEGLQIATRPQQYIDYLPHLYLAIAHQMTGDVAKAREELGLAETSGVASKSEIGRPLLVAYQILLRGDTNVRYGKPRYAVYSAKAPLLSEEEFSMLRRDVLEKCDLPLDTKQATAPWYANYEIGLELEQKGDYTRALTHFIDAVAHRPNPQKQARTYGMWLIDYYPYFHIARSHVRLQNWQCAKNALDISQKVGEIPAAAPEFQEFLAMQQETAKKLSQ